MHANDDLVDALRSITRHEVDAGERDSWAWAGLLSRAAMTGGLDRLRAAVWAAPEAFAEAIGDAIAAAEAGDPTGAPSVFARRQLAYAYIEQRRWDDAAIALEHLLVRLRAGGGPIGEDEVEVVQEHRRAALGARSSLRATGWVRERHRLVLGWLGPEHPVTGHSATLVGESVGARTRSIVILVVAIVVPSVMLVFGILNRN